MKNPGYKLVVGLLLILGMNGAQAQEVEVMVAERYHVLYQDGSDSLVSIMAQPGFDDWFDFAFFGFVETTSGSFSQLEITSPNGANTITIPEMYPGEYEVEVGFATRSELEAATPAGTYTFSGTGSTVGAFTETVTLPAYSPIIPKKVTNFEALQAFDPSQPVEISWESFAADLNGEDGFIEVRISYWDGSGMVDVWNSDALAQDGAFGLPPETTSVTVPADTLVGSPYDTYDLNIVFFRIDDIGPTQNFSPLAILGAVTSAETFLHIHPVEDTRERIYLVEGELYNDPVLGPIQGIRTDWGFNFHTGFFNVAHTPDWIYQWNIGWLRVPSSGHISQGLWLWSPSIGWIYYQSGWQGWYYSPGNGWNNMRFPFEDWQP